MARRIRRRRVRRRFRGWRRGVFSHEGFFDDRVARQLVTAQGVWPPRPSDVEGALDYVERFLRFDDDLFDFLSLTRQAGRRGRALPADLSTLLERLSRVGRAGEDLRLEISGEQAERIWARLCERAEELSAHDEHPVWGDPNELDAWELFKMLNVIVAEGMTYVRGLFGSDLSFSPEQDSTWLEGFELFLVSFIKVFTTDFRALGWLARQPLELGFSGLCRHYSLVVQILFDIARRATGRHADTFVVTISGTHEFLIPFDHAWTWFVDASRGVIVPVDLTGADWLYDREIAESIFNAGFDASRFNNASALVRTLTFHGLTSPSDVITAELLEQVLPRMIDVETVHGQALLLNLVRQNLTPEDVRSRVLAFLESRHREVLAPHIEAITDSRYTRMANSALAESEAYARVLDALGVD